MQNLEESWNKFVRCSAATCIVALVILATCWGGYGAGTGGAIASLYALSLAIVICSCQQSGSLKQTPCTGCCVLCPDCSKFTTVFHLRNAFVALVVFSVIGTVPGIVTGSILLSVADDVREKDHWYDYNYVDDDCALTCFDWLPSNCSTCFQPSKNRWSGEPMYEVAKACCAYGNDPSCSGNYTMQYGADCPRGCTQSCAGSFCDRTCLTCQPSGIRNAQRITQAWPCYHHQERDAGVSCRQMCECLGGYADKCSPPPIPQDDTHNQDEKAHLTTWGATALINGFATLCLSVFAGCAASAASAVIREQGGPSGASAVIEVGRWVGNASNPSPAVVGTPVLGQPTGIQQPTAIQMENAQVK